MTNRFNELGRILEQALYFKVVCGAGNEDPEEVYRLSLVYTLAGALGIDVSANVQVVEAAMRGVDRALDLAGPMGVEIVTRPFINVSVGLKGDPHVRKARILEANCTGCGLCLDACDQEAVGDDPYQVITARCIGCGQCAGACEFEAIEFYTRKVDFHDILPRCIQAGAENLELHAIIADDEAVMEDWRIINQVLPDQFVSMCLDRSQLGNERLRRRIHLAKELAGERLMIQADGAPMSGGADDFRTTLQAVATADEVQKMNLGARILVSGGTNRKTGELVRLCGLTVHGVSVGTNARNLVRAEIKQPDFDTNSELVKTALDKAGRLVRANMDPIRRDGHGR